MLRFTWGVRKEVIDMQSRSERESQVENSAPQSDGRQLLLEEVDFKWLMAGLGWWIDMPRFHRDSSYATRFMELAMASDSMALRDCAASLQSQNDGSGHWSDPTQGSGHPI